MENKIDIKIEQHGNKSIIFLENNLSVGADATKVQNAVLDLIQQGSKTIITDLSNLKYITSWGVGILIYAHTTCKNKNVDFSLTGLNDKILSTLKKVKLDGIFKIS